jgi:GR25 family glycosyltransferase involved in LPS biosynthesis
LYTSTGEKEKGMYYLVESFKYDVERQECVFYLVQNYATNEQPLVAYQYYKNIQNFYENHYLSSNIEGKLFVEPDKGNMLLPYYMILVSDKIKEIYPEAKKTIKKMFEIIFIKKYRYVPDFYIGNTLYNLQFFMGFTLETDKEFVNLFQSYIYFLESIKHPLHKYNEFLKKYTKYGININSIKKITNNFTVSECEKSNKILFYTGFCNVPWNYTYSLNNALGGSETAVANLAKRFPNNYEIYIAGSVNEEKINNVNYINIDTLRGLMDKTPFHTVIVSRYVGFYEIFEGLSFYQSFIWAHDISLFNYGCDMDVKSIINKWNNKINGCICQTEWHMNLFNDLYPELKNKLCHINNGITIENFITKPKKISNRFIYTSCTERGLDRLLEIWPKIEDQFSDAELLICSYNEFPKNDFEKRLASIIKNHDNISHLGQLKRDDLYKLMATVEYWLYPTNFSETSCITAMEMLMSEVICIYYPVAGLVNTLGDYGIAISRDNEVNTVLNLTTKQKNDIRKRGREYALSCSWEKRSKKWCNMVFSNEIIELSEKKMSNIIKVVNLKRREDRRMQMEEQLKKANITNFDFFVAVDGKELQSSVELYSLFEDNDFNYKKGVVGCALSHIQLWNELLNDKSTDYYVVLEDDVVLCDNFKTYLDIVCKLFIEQKLEHLALGEYKSNKKFPEENYKFRVYSKDLYKEWHTSFAYIISKQAALKIINYINNCSIKCAIDNPQAFGNILTYSALNYKLVNAEIVNEFGSDIQLDEIICNFNFGKTKTTITVSFCDWWKCEYSGGDFDINNNFFVNTLRDYSNYDITTVNPNDNPDVLFYSIFGNNHKIYNAKRKVFFSGEPYPQREDADFNISFDPNSYKNTRVPLWVCYFDNILIKESLKKINNQFKIPEKNKFCSFLASGPGLENNRKAFIDKLSIYKEVDCGGSYLNNIGYEVPRGHNSSGKILHNKEYKFAMAFESKSYPGYVTEKICDIYKSNTVPIYWGTPDVVKDFNPTTFINANDFSNFDELIKYIKKVDRDDNLYAQYFVEPVLTDQWIDVLTTPGKPFFKNLADKIIGKKDNLFNNYINTFIDIKGYVKKPTAYICGCVKNCEMYLSNVFDNIKNLITLFDSYKIVIAYDNSNDNTYDYLVKMKEFYNIEIINCNSNFNTRVENICNARNSILQYIRSKTYNPVTYDYLIMMDMDNVSCEKMNTDVITYYLNRDDWDALSFNLPDYYDIFALSIDPYIHSCWHWKNDKDLQVTEVVEIMRKYVNYKLSNMKKTELLECLSAFNGFAIYRNDKFNNCNYGCDHSYNMNFLDTNIGNNWLEKNINAINNKYLLRFDEKQDCEHRIFHLEAVYKNNAKIRISPLSIFDFSNETKQIIKHTNKNN